MYHPSTIAKMKTQHFLLISAVLLFTACNKDELNSRKQAMAEDNLVIHPALTIRSFPDSIKIPLTDMGRRTYYGYLGGLYPNAASMPSGQYAADLSEFAGDIVPLDTFGNYNTSKGKIGFIAIGASTCAITMNRLRDKTVGNPLTNPYLAMATATDGGTSVDEIMNAENYVYWDTAFSKLKKNDIDYRQVEVIYFETDDSLQTSDFPGRPLLSKDKYAQAMRTFKLKFPNIKLVYLLGRTTAFIKPKKSGKVTNSEPVPYENGWTCKFVIQDQINGVSGLEYKGASAVAPMVTWGWYEWAYGTDQPRNDGFTWTIDDTIDGLHANDEGADTLSTNFQNFLLNDPYASIWYAKH